jgi:hypothetical protein
MDNDFSHTEKSAIVHLKNEVQETFGRKISTSRDCIELSDAIFHKTSVAINANTLRRLFGLVKTEYAPSVSTLNILSRYCGFDSIHQLSSAKLSGRDKATDKSELNILLYLVSLFRNIRVEERSNEIFYDLVQETIQFIQRHLDLADRFQRAIAQTKNGQDYYFEQFINTDKLNSFYGDGLRFYLAEKKTPEAQIFGHSLLCTRGWLVGDDEMVRHHFEIVSKNRIQKSMSPLAAGFYYAAHIYFADVNKINTERTLIDAQHAYAILKSSNALVLPHFEFPLSMALMLTQHFEEALFYVTHASKPRPGASRESGVYTSLQLVHGISLARIGAVDEARKIFDSIQPSRFYFIRRKTHTILYLLLDAYINKLSPKVEEQLQILIEDTGFTKLESLIHLHY